MNKGYDDIELAPGSFGTWPRDACLGMAPLKQLLFIHIWTYANNMGKAWPSIKTLCSDTGMSKRSVLKYIDELVTDNLLMREKRTRADGSFTSNIYTVNVATVVLARPRCNNAPRLVQKGTNKNILSEHSLETNTKVFVAATPQKAPLDKGGTLKEVKGAASNKGCIEIWTAAMGVPNYAAFGKALKPVIAAIGPEATERALSAYLDQEKSYKGGVCRTPQGFAQRFRVYVKEEETVKDDPFDPMRYVKIPPEHRR